MERYSRALRERTRYVYNPRLQGIFFVSLRTVALCHARVVQNTNGKMRDLGGQHVHTHRWGPCAASAQSVMPTLRPYSPSAGAAGD